MTVQLPTGSFPVEALSYDGTIALSSDNTPIAASVKDQLQVLVANLHRLGYSEQAINQFSQMFLASQKSNNSVDFETPNVSAVDLSKETLVSASSEVFDASIESILATSSPEFTSETQTLSQTE